MRKGLAHLGTAVLVLTIAMMLVVDTTTASPSSTGGTIGIRAKSSFEQSVNPFGDEWSTKQGPNRSIPNWLTPMCHRTPQLDGVAWPQADEVALAARSNTGFLWEECGDPMEATDGGGSGRNGDPEVKDFVAAVKQINPSIKYIGYRNVQVHSTTQLCAGITPAGLLDFEGKEDYFLHVNDAPVTKANRVKFDNNRRDPRCAATVYDGNDVYDFTNPAFRQDLANHIKKSLEFHKIDGLVIDNCFDQPRIPGPGPSQAKLNAWAQGCVDLLSTFKQTMPDKLIYFTGYLHIGTQTQPSPVNEEAAFQLYQQRLNVSDGFFWEDPLGPILGHESGLVPGTVRFIVGRYKRVRDAALAQNKLMANVIGTGVQRQTTFGSTSREQQLQLERFYLAGQMILRDNRPGSDGLKTPFLLYTPTAFNVPTSDNQSFASNAFFKDWEYNIGSPLDDYTQPTEGVFVREYQRARVVWNFTNAPFTVGLRDGTFRTLDGQSVTISVVGPFSGMIFRGPGADPIPPEVTACTPTRPKVTTTVTRQANGQLQVDIGTTNGGGYLHTIEITRVAGATVGFQGGQQGITGPATFTAEPAATTQRLNIQRAGGALTVQLTVTDGCGAWQTFVGGGPGVN